jgi:hypothetical protein
VPPRPTPTATAPAAPRQKAKTTSPTERTLAQLRGAGFTVAVVERWVPAAKRRVDLFGIGDLLAIKTGTVLLVQATTAGNLSARVNKALAEPRLRTWLEAGGLFVVCGWSKRGPRGKRKTWEPTWRWITLGPDGEPHVESHALDLFLTHFAPKEK